MEVGESTSYLKSQVLKTENLEKTISALRSKLGEKDAVVRELESRALRKEGELAALRAEQKRLQTELAASATQQVWERCSALMY